MLEPTVVSGVQRYLRSLLDQGIEVSFGIVFGSQVTGKCDTWSDIDLVVVSPRFDEAVSREDVNRLWRVAARTDSRIEPFPCGDKQWESDASSPLLAIARAEGERVSLAGEV